MLLMCFFGSSISRLGARQKIQLSGKKEKKVRLGDRTIKKEHRYKVTTVAAVLVHVCVLEHVYLNVYQ